MRSKKAVAGFEVVLMIASLFAFSYMIYASTPVRADSVMSSPSYCCERTGAGASCINTNESNCAEGYRSSPTSCETTSYCKLGTCYDSEEGLCMENTPQIVCEENGGTWDSRDIGQVPQCQLGCCIISDQAAFVSLVRCKRLSTLFGVENNYNKNIGNEVDCIATAQAQDMGACVYEQDFERVCEFTTRADCGAGNVVESVNGTEVELSTEKKFYEDYLCSAEELNTACARQTATACYNGKVYFVDSCGNRENVYSSNKDVSWNNGRVAEPKKVCAPNDGSDGNCGNCEYLLGARCAEWSGVLGIGKPADSEHYCQKTECADREGNERMNGESWCVYDGEIGEGRDSVGSRSFREVCVDGEVRVEPCEDFRNEICLEGSIETDEGDFGTSGCRVNRWHDCTTQIEEDDCINIDRRDCMWVDPVAGMMLGGGDDGESESSGTFSNPTTEKAFNNPAATGNVVAPITGNSIFGGDDEEEEEETVTNRPEGICVPNYPPGFEFWEDPESLGLCGLASAKCVVTFEENLLGKEKCVDNCECLEEGWALQANRVCASLGDCGAYINYHDDYADDGYLWKEDGRRREFYPNSVNQIRGGFTGMVVGGITGMLIAKTPSYSIVPRSAAEIKGGLAATDITLTDNIAGDLVSAHSELSGLATEGNLHAVYNPATSQYTFSGSGLKAPVILDKAAGEAVLNSAGYELQANPGSTLSKILGFGGGSGLDALASGLQWAAVAYGIGYLVGSLVGMEKQNTQALSTSLAAGAFVYKGLATWNGFSGGGGFLAAKGSGTILGAFGWGSVVAVTVFLIMYKKTEIVVVTFDCLPWQAPVGGNNCETCNDENLPCSEYRCKSLGQNCELVNPGTGQERCVNVNPKDVDPPVITPDEEELTFGHEYKDVKLSPPGPGFRIVNSESSDGCLKAFTPLKFGVDTNEPSQCKIDFNHTTTFEEMNHFFGGNNFFAYEHSEQFSLPGAKELGESFILENGNEFTFFVRCMDKNGNENEAEYAVRFCVDDGPDATAPEIKATSILNGGCVAEESSSVTVDFYTNEPAECRWSTTDQGFANMQNQMTCSDQYYQVNAMQLFTCRTNLTGVARDETNFYVRCKDQPGRNESDRNENLQSFVFSLRGSTGLKIKEMKPNGTIFGGVSPAPVELYVETLFGCDEGKAVCYYSTTGTEDDYIMFFDTDNEDGIHTQRQDLVAGDHKYYIKCVDAGGNVVEDTLEFTLDIDTNAPVVARVYEEEQMLKIVTVRDSECAYSFDNCDFTFDEGTAMPYANSTTHVAEWNDKKTYYVKCRDEFRNEDADCSVVVRPSKDIL